MQLTIQDIPLDAVLCYVKDNIAYFTTQELSKQWGDDWDDAPYEHNAGRPYTPFKVEGGRWEIITLIYEADLECPCDRGYINSPYSVQAINHGAIAWLSPPSYSNSKIYIQAGTTIRDFIEKIHATGGTVYVPIKQGETHV